MDVKNILSGFIDNPVCNFDINQTQEIHLEFLNARAPILFPPCANTQASFGCKLTGTILPKPALKRVKIFFSDDSVNWTFSPYKGCISSFD